MTELKNTGCLGLPPSCTPLSQQTGQNYDYISSPKPAINNLHNDILWWIFWLNADMKDETEDEDPDRAILAIDTLRYSSQVCSRWRKIILSFSSLWGQAINLSYLEHDEWRAEVLRRTGRSFLSVFWLREGLQDLSEKIIAEIFERNWDRIRWLELNFTNSDLLDNVSMLPFWKTFQRPSEVLEVFRVFFEHRDRKYLPILPLPDFVLFSNLAPALRAFAAPSITFNPDAPWLTTIRSLTLSRQVSAYDVLQAIAHMPLLERLTDESAIVCTGLALHALPQITAPSIKEITLQSYWNMGPYMSFLTRITPGAGCYLTFSHNGSLPGAKMLTLANEVLYRYSRCCDLPSSSDISLELHQPLFSFTAQIPRKGKFYFELRPNDEFRCDAIRNLLAALPLVKFQEVKSLSLNVSPHIFKLDNSEITQFILSVASVETLSINVETLCFLLNLPSDFLALSFPVLHKVEIDCLIQEEEGEIGELSSVERFLASRISIGRPLSVLSMLIIHDSCVDLDLRSLDEFTGLTIILRDGGKGHKHICGNGQIEDLFFPRRSEEDFASSASESSASSSLESSSEGE